MNMTSAKEQVENAIKYIGLCPSKFEIFEKMREHGPDPEYVVALDFLVSVKNGLKMRDIADIFRPSIDGILEGELVRREVRDPLELKIKDLEERCAAQDKLLLELTPYANYYALEYGLKHGKRLDTK